MELQLLADNEEVIPIVASWYVEEWGHLEGARTLPNMIEGLRDYLNKDRMPLMVLAMKGDEVIGVAQLKFREMDIYPDKEHWLGGVYVSSDYRGNKIARKIVVKIVSIAEKLGVGKLYLQTIRLDGGLYAKLGWNPLEQVKYRGEQVLVMEKLLGA